MALTAEEIGDLTSEYESLAAAEAAEAAQLAQAVAITDRMEAAALAAGVSIDAMAASISDLAEKANKAKALEEAKRAFEDIAKLQGQVAAGGAETAKAGAGAAQAAKGVDTLGKSAEGALDKLKPTGGILGTVTQALEGLGPKGKAAAVVITVLVTVITAAAVAFWSLAKAAVSISQEKDALAETFGAITDGAKSGLAVVNELSDVAAKLPFDEGKVLGWGKAMAAAGKSGDDLVQSVNAIAASAAIMRNNGEAALNFSKRLQTAADVGEKIKLDRRMQRMLAETGVRATELAKALGIPEDKLSSMAIDAGKLGDAFEKALISKGAGALQKMSLTWASITGKLGDAWEDLFEDLGPAVEPLMSAIRDFFGEFSAGMTLQGAAKGALTSFFTTVFGWAARVTRALHIMFLEAQIGALKAYIALAPLVTILRLIFTNALVLRGLKILLVIIAAAIGVVVASFVAMGVAMGIVGAIFGFVASLIWSAILAIVGAVEGIVEALITGGTKGASGFITGLVEGIKGGAGQVAQAVKDLAKNAEQAFTEFFGIRSPSTRMKKHGRQLPAGGAEGVDEGAQMLQESMETAFSPPKKRGGRAGRGGGRGKLADTITVVFKGRADEFDDFRVQMESWLDQQEAAGPEPEPA